MREWTDKESFFVFVNLDGSPCSGESATLAVEPIGGQAPFTYAWSTGETAAEIAIADEGNHRVKVTDAQGCTATGLRTYLPGLLGGSLDVVGPCNLACDGEPITLRVRDPKPTSEYSWIIGNDTLRGTSISTTRAGEYRVFGTDSEFADCQEQGSFFCQFLHPGRLSRNRVAQRQPQYDHTSPNGQRSRMGVQSDQLVAKRSGCVANRRDPAKPARFDPTTKGSFQLILHP